MKRTRLWSGLGLLAVLVSGSVYANTPEEQCKLDASNKHAACIKENPDPPYQDSPWGYGFNSTQLDLECDLDCAVDFITFNCKEKCVAGVLKARAAYDAYLRALQDAQNNRKKCDRDYLTALDKCEPD